MDKIHVAPQKKPWNDDCPVKNQQTMVSMLFQSGAKWISQPPTVGDTTSKQISLHPSEGFSWRRSRATTPAVSAARWNTSSSLTSLRLAQSFCRGVLCQPQSSVKPTACHLSGTGLRGKNAFKKGAWHLKWLGSASALERSKAAPGDGLEDAHVVLAKLRPTNPPLPPGGRKRQAHYEWRSPEITSLLQSTWPMRVEFPSALQTGARSWKSRQSLQYVPCRDWAAHEFQAHGLRESACTSTADKQCMGCMLCYTRWEPVSP